MEICWKNVMKNIVSLNLIREAPKLVLEEICTPFLQQANLPMDLEETLLLACILPIKKSFKTMTSESTILQPQKELPRLMCPKSILVQSLAQLFISSSATKVVRTLIISPSKPSNG